MTTANTIYRTDQHGRLHYDFHPGQWRAWDSPARFVCVLSGAQGGKTTFGPAWLHREIKTRGPGHYLVATPTYPLLYAKALPEFLALFQKRLKLGSYRDSPVKQFRFNRKGLAALFGKHRVHPSTTVTFGHASDPDSLEAATCKAAWLDEVGQKKFKIGSWEAIQRRLAVNQGRVLFTTTPYYLGWLKTLVADQAADNPDYALIRFESRDNPAFPPEEWCRLQAALPPWKFDLSYRALWSRPAGLIFDNWTDHHKVLPFSIPSDWPRFVGIDFGGLNTAALYYAQNPDTGLYYAYKTYHPAQKRTVSQHVRAILEDQPPGLTAVGGSPSEDQWRLEFKHAGLIVKKPPISDVEVGIDRLYAAHNAGQIKVFDTLTEYFDEKAAYARILDDSGEPTDQIEDKADYHLMDCERYLWSYLGEQRGTGKSVIIPPVDILANMKW